ncbi:MAG TPA: heme ABC transporter permease [Rickettsia endosymbiont of Sericostoma sp.]|jgi:heme exporter protein C|uniref:heme ABC transporter permease n=1 Tax=unclassified Candidatus Tisiphia TaxID=2996318 RepID=UPI001D3EFDCA|nr:heme ABC transporter permease [Rickettsia endosymbiont of Sericostoma sp. HW-2014]HJD63716.1 heme ABC transporter permease [Rickettsia endosymbiont of Sericostoma sp.]
MLKLLNPYFFSKLVRTMLPLLLVAMLVVMGLGLYQALIVSPPDYQQGDMVRIMYVHVPASWMALGIYTFIAICSLSNLVWKTKMSFLMAVASAPIGAVFCMISIVTGALWGKPIWGTWWVWDARLTSMFVLFLLYLSYIVVVNSGDRISRTEKPASVIALIGFINVPIVKFSVNIWYSLHQPASVLRLGSPTIDNSMLLPLVLMFISAILYFLLVLGLRSCMLIAKFKEYDNL